jgi:hypothetical protein
MGIVITNSAWKADYYPNRRRKTAEYLLVCERCIVGCAVVRTTLGVSDDAYPIAKAIGVMNPMRPYVIVSGSIFGMVTIAHLLRIIYEPQLGTDPWYLLLTAACAAMSVWALRLLWKAPAPKEPPTLG